MRFELYLILEAQFPTPSNPRRSSDCYFFQGNLSRKNVGRSGKKERKRKERRVSCLFLVSIRSLTDNNTLHTGIVNTKSRSMDKINRGGVTPYPTKHLERLESQNSLIDASAQHKIRRLMDLVALKSIIVLSGRGIERTRYIENGTYR